MPSVAATANRLYLLGGTTGHSLSAPTWNRVFGVLGLDWAYAGWDVAPEALPDAMARLRRPDVIGANVTMPHKIAAVRLADEWDEAVERTGAANWLGNAGGVLRAGNTDVAGARDILGDQRFERCVLLGAGGAARAVALASVGRVGKLSIVNRTRDRADRLADAAKGWGTPACVEDWARLPVAVSSADLVVNATPLGGSGSLTSDSIPPGWFASGARLYDLVYADEPTALVRAADAAGVPVCDGLAHLEAQAVAMLPLLGLADAVAALVSQALAGAAGRRPRRWDR